MISLLVENLCIYPILHSFRLIVAIKMQPTQLVLRLLKLVKRSRPFVVFHPHKEPLMELFVQLKERGGVVNLKLSETWFRSIQVDVICLQKHVHRLIVDVWQFGHLRLHILSCLVCPAYELRLT